jgi:hypothetical protein
MGITIFSSALFTVERHYCPNRDAMTSADIDVYLRECDHDFHRGVSPTHGLCCTEENSPNDFSSIVAAMWWACVTMTSVGYGEVVPKTGLGKIVGVVASLVGMVLIALPVAIVGQKFQDVYEQNDVEEAKQAASRRMRVSGEVWNLVPPSDVLARLRNLNVNESARCSLFSSEKARPEDASLGDVVRDFSSLLEEVWEQREQLNRERKASLEKQGQDGRQLDVLLEQLGLERKRRADPTNRFIELAWEIEELQQQTVRLKEQAKHPLGHERDAVISEAKRVNELMKRHRGEMELLEQGKYGNLDQSRISSSLKQRALDAKPPD